MANLTATAQFSRKAFRVLLLLGGLALVVFLTITFSAPLRNALFPPQDVAVAAFGKLPQIDMSESIAAPAGIEYTLETISGGLPELPIIANVFGIKTPVPSFGDLDQAKKTAMIVGFAEQPISYVVGKAVFVNEKEGTSLTIDTASGNFVLSSDYLNSQKVISTSPASVDASTKKATNFIGGFNLTENDFPTDGIETINYKVDGGKLTEAISVASSNLTQVNFRRAQVNKYPIYSPNFKKPRLWVLVGANGVVAANNTTRNIQKHKFSAYPLKGVTQAYEELKSAKGYFNKQLLGDSFQIRSVELGYLETQGQQEYLQPVYVFKGDEGLLAFVGAVDSQWIQSTPSTTFQSPGRF